jgi:predicted flap endonuclease-1-like 5' DNA nuclease
MFEQAINQGPGTGSFATHTFEILIMLLGAFLLGLWLGWTLWNRNRQVAEKLRVDNQSLEASVLALRGENDSIRTALTTINSEKDLLTAQLVTAQRDNTLFRERLQEIDLHLNSTMNLNRKLETELALSAEPETPATTVELEIEMPVSQPFTPNPEPEPVAETPTPTFQDEPDELPIIPPFEDDASYRSSITEIPPPPPPVMHTQRDDLRVIEGIGPKIEEVLYSNGIQTYRDLAVTSVDRIREILATAGPRYTMHNPGTWSAQANLAANGEWENLKAYQDFLNAGKSK